MRTHWILGADRLAKLARLIGRADATMFGEASMRRAFLSKVRLDAAPGEAVADGLSPSSLELSAFDRWALRAIKRAPDRWLKLVGVSRVFAAKARRLVGSSSGLCLVVARDDGEATDLLVGRAMQRAWLALTAEGLAVQPMMSLLVLENVSEHGAAALVESLGRGKLAALRDEFRALVPEIGGWRPAFLMRFGFAPAPSGRTGRLPLQAVAAYSTASPGPVPGARSVPGPIGARRCRMSDGMTNPGSGATYETRTEEQVLRSDPGDRGIRDPAWQHGHVPFRGGPDGSGTRASRRDRGTKAVLHGVRRQGRGLGPARVPLREPARVPAALAPLLGTAPAEVPSLRRGRRLRARHPGRRIGRISWTSFAMPTGSP